MKRLCLVLLLCGSFARAESVAEATRRLRAAHAAGDTARFRELAAKTHPDPFRVLARILDEPALLEAFADAAAPAVAVCARHWIGATDAQRAEERDVADFHRRLGKRSAPETALRAARLGRVKTHPYYWAGFVFWGATSD